MQGHFKQTNEMIAVFKVVDFESLITAYGCAQRCVTSVLLLADIVIVATRTTGYEHSKMNQCMVCQF